MREAVPVGSMWVEKRRTPLSGRWKITARYELIESSTVKVPCVRLSDYSAVSRVLHMTRAYLLANFVLDGARK